MEIDQNKNRRQSSITLKQLISWLFLIALSISACLPVFMWLPKNTAFQWILAGLLYLLAVAGILLCTRWLVFHFVPARLERYSPVWKGFVTAGSLLGGIWVSLNVFFTIPCRAKLTIDPSC
jgi:hypothetical protein